MLHIEERGVTSQASGAHVNRDSRALGMEVGYAWRFYKGLYAAPRVGALHNGCVQS